MGLYTSYVGIYGGLRWCRCVGGIGAEIITTNGEPYQSQMDMEWKLLNTYTHKHAAMYQIRTYMHKMLS